ncbi:uncharacterized protein F4812DRAFT_119136 [Daldinia caldariorum]|uniref:uncharacterized protein n=1 Tax=Daldinia caldariorum TaxID=326644 RepID=UPI00200820E3|nr:uncharacterized protein F4812DRAFT_119136 [Daldinia caldariorum]KAI1465363.1 hypothetical protein F4812DRAFT_119136 [Daldinia caldariorum]
MPRPLRSSCDRCHSQKLKCPKQPGIATCTRCLKAGAACVFSPAGLTTRRALPPSGLAYSNCDLDMMNMQFDWPPFDMDFDNALVTPPDLSQGSSSDRQGEQTELPPQDTRSTSVRFLTSLAVEIDQLSITLSNVSHVHVPKNRPAQEYHDKFIENSARSVCIEQLFTVTQSLADNYPQVLSVLFDRPDSPDCQDPDCFHRSELPPDLQVFFPASGDNQYEIDTFLFNLLVSCHGKAVNAIGTIISCARTCTQVALSSSDFVEPHVHIPEVRVGNFVATNTTASAMHIVLLIHVTSVLVDNAQQLTKLVTAALEGRKDSKQAQMLKLQCEVLEENSISKMKLLQQAKGLFTGMNLRNFERGTASSTR